LPFVERPRSGGGAGSRGAATGNVVVCDVVGAEVIVSILLTAICPEPAPSARSNVAKPATEY
jgi:hypothetical protein